MDFKSIQEVNSEDALKELKAADLIKELVFSDSEKFSTFDNVSDLYTTVIKRQCFIGEITEDTGDALQSYIQFYNCMDDENNIPIEERRPIYVYIDSPGGSLTGTLTIVDSITMSKTPVYTINMGTAYSGGFFSFIAGHKRFAYPHSSFMFHEGSTGTSADAGKFRNFSDFYEKQLDQLKEITLKNCPAITEEVYEQHKRDDWWMTAEEAIQYSVCDKIATSLTDL